MGQKLINAICTVFRSDALNLGVEYTQLHAVVALVVKTLRKSGMADDDIAARFGRADYQE